MTVSDRWSLFKKWVSGTSRYPREETILFILTLLIGAIVGLVVVAFILVTENLGARMYPAGGVGWRRLVIPVAGSLLTGILLYRYFPNARGSGIPQTKIALFLQGGVIRFRTVVGKFTCSALALASGIALGREGPSVQVGAGIASTLGRRLGLSPAQTKSLVPIGSSAALAAAFNTPIAAVLFTLEEVMGDLHARVLGAIVLSSAMSWMVLHLLLGDEPLFHVPAYQLVHPIEFLFYAVLGVVGGLVSVAFVKFLLWLRKRFNRLPIWTQQFQPVAGGLVVGILGWFVPGVLGVGYNHVSEALNGQVALTTMLLLVALKLVATSTCYASGNAGGIFGPSLFLGAMLGGAVGGVAHMLMPDYTGSVGAYALVGMGTAFAGIIRVPLTSVIMIFEVTRDYSIIVPLMIANLMSYFISSRLQEEQIYEALMHQDGVHLPPPRVLEEQEPVLVARGLRTAGESFSSSDVIEDVIARADSHLQAWPVVDQRGFAGMVTRAQLEEAAREGRQNAPLAELLPRLNPHVPLNADLFPHVHLDHPVSLAVRRMAKNGLDVLPVVSRDDIHTLAGVITLQDALAAYRTETEKNEEPAYLESRTPVTLLGGVLAVLLALVAVAGFLNYYFREQRSARAQEYFEDGTKLMQKERYQEAIENFRNALSITHTFRDRLALAETLLKAGRSSEAEIYFRELQRADPDNGPTNLGLGRIAVERSRMEDALKYYRAAIYGSWPKDSEDNRIGTRFELVNALGKSGRRSQAQAELLAFVGEDPHDLETERQLAHLLLAYDLPRQATRLYRKIIEKKDDDADAYAGLGQAEYAQANYRAARTAYQNALRSNPSNASTAERLKVTEEILDLNPKSAGLGRVERYQRSQKLLEAVLGSVDQCSALAKGTPPASLKENADAARRVLLRHGRPQSYSDAVEGNLSLAEQLWKTRLEACGAPTASEEPISRLMMSLSSEAAQ